VKNTYIAQEYWPSVIYCLRLEGDGGEMVRAQAPAMARLEEGRVQIRDSSCLTFRGVELLAVLVEATSPFSKKGACH
jgi:hypothetical protein